MSVSNYKRYKCDLCGAKEYVKEHGDKKGRWARLVVPRPAGTGGGNMEQHYCEKCLDELTALCNRGRTAAYECIGLILKGTLEKGRKALAAEVQ